MYGNLTAGH